MNFDDLIAVEGTCDAAFKADADGVVSIRTTADRKVEFVSFENGKTLALVKSAMGYPAYYPVHSTEENLFICFYPRRRRPLPGTGAVRKCRLEAAPVYPATSAR